MKVSKNPFTLLEALLNIAPTTTATYNGTSIKAFEALAAVAAELSPRALCSTYTCLAFIATALDIKNTSPPSIKAATRSPSFVRPLDTDDDDDNALVSRRPLLGVFGAALEEAALLRRRIANLLLLFKASSSSSSSSLNKSRSAKASA